MSSNAPIAVLTCRVASFSTTKSNVPVAGRSLRKKINMATTVKQAFQKLKENLEITGLQEETVATRQKSVREVLDAGLTVKESFLTGSYARSTMIAPLSDADVDIFAVLDVSYYHNYNGQNGGQAGLLDLVKRTLRKTYTKTPDISRNGQAVTICFDDFRVDVVPAFYRQGGGFLIPNSIRQVWLSTDPKKHVTIMNESNSKHNEDMVPLVKMIKGWNKNVGSFFMSFHLEVLALSVLNNVTISSFPSAVRFYFDKGKDLINKQNIDPAGLGGDVGAYLNTKEKIQEAVDKFQLAYERSIKAEEYESRGYIQEAIETWRKVFGDYFPAYG